MVYEWQLSNSRLLDQLVPALLEESPQTVTTLANWGLIFIKSFTVVENELDVAAEVVLVLKPANED